jgi:hypothetical protein
LCLRTGGIDDRTARFRRERRRGNLRARKGY